jgi:CarD family transcriptional regulator
MKYKVGDKAVVPNLGVGVVKEIKTLKIDDFDYQMYVFECRSGQGTCLEMVPVNNLGANGVRDVIPTEAVERVYDILRDKDTPADKQTWNRRYREYLSKIKTGDPLEVAAVLRDLARLKSEKTLSFGERKMFDQAHSLIVQEIAVARNVEEKAIEDELEALFAR